MPEERELNLRIVLEKPPAGVDFGLQKGRGGAYETIQKQRSTGADVIFSFTVGVRRGPVFTGPLAQGPPSQRFVYMDIGTYAGQKDTPWSRRLKIPLAGITDEVADQLDDSRYVLETRVPGTGKDGGPSCATPKPFGGWQITKR